MEYYLAIKKVRNSAICSHMERSRDCHIEWSKPEREKQISYINACKWNLEKMVQISLTFEVGDFCLSVPMQKEAWDHYTRQRSGNRVLEGTWEPFEMTIVIKKRLHFLWHLHVFEYVINWIFYELNIRYLENDSVEKFTFSTLHCSFQKVFM